MLSFPETQSFLSSLITDLDQFSEVDQWTFKDLSQSIDSISWFLDRTEAIDWTLVNTNGDEVEIESALVKLRGNVDAPNESTNFEIYLTKREAGLLHILIMLVSIAAGSKVLNGQEIAGVNALTVLLIYAGAVAINVPSLFDQKLEDD